MNRVLKCGMLVSLQLWIPMVVAQEQQQQIIEITYEKCLSLAVKNAPELRSAIGRVQEAESKVTSASLLRFNPELSGSVGPRFDTDGTSVDWSIGALQWLEIGGQKGKRIKAALEAALASEARRKDTQRRVLRDVSLAFIQVLYWNRRVALAEENLVILESVARVASKRHEVGDVGGLERSVSELAVLRARSDRERIKVSSLQTMAYLKELLAIDTSVEVVCVGDLRKLSIPYVTHHDVDERPDVQALGADIRQAEAEAALGRASKAPNLALGVDYANEESADIVQGTLVFQLPVFDHGQGTSAIAEARRERLQAELDAVRNAASMEIKTSQTTLKMLRNTVLSFEQEGLETLLRAEQIATVSYESGAIPLGELLAVRQELVKTKLEYINLLLGVATAQVDLAASTGAFQ